MYLYLSHQLLDDSSFARAERGSERVSWLILLHDPAAPDDKAVRTAAARFKEAASKLNGNVQFGSVECGASNQRSRLRELCGEIDKDRAARRGAKESKPKKKNKAAEWDVSGAVVVAVKVSKLGGEKATTVGRYRGGASANDLAQYCNDKLLSDKLVSAISPMTPDPCASSVNRIPTPR